MREESSKLQTVNYRTAIACSIIVIINIIFKWNKNQYSNTLLDVPMYIYKIQDAIKVSGLFATVIGVIVLILALTSFIGTGVFQVSVKTNFKIIGIFIVTVIIYFIFKSSYIMITIDKYMYEKDRAKVASMVVDGEIGKGGKFEMFELPKEYKKVSKDNGRIIVRRDNENIWIYFTTYRGLANDERNTFVYCKEDSQKLLPDTNGYIYEEKKLKEHWFWAVIR